MENTSTDNAFNLVVHDLIGMQFASMGTQQAVASSNTFLTTANQKLTANWTTCPESNPNDPGYVAWYYLQKVTGNSAKLTAPTSNPLTPTQQGTLTPAGGINAWMTVFLKGTSDNYTNELSSAFMTQVEGAYETWLSGQPSTTNNQVNLLTNYTSLIQAAAQAGEQTGQNGITLLNNLSQHFETDQGPVSQATSTLLDGYNNYSSSLSQISA